MIPSSLVAPGWPMNETEHTPAQPANEAVAPPPVAPPPEPAPAPPAQSERELWLEVTAVLAVGVIPHFARALASLAHRQPPAPFWIDALDLCITSLCTSFVVLYLI